MVIMVIGPDTVYCWLSGLCHCRYRPSSTHNAGLQGGIFTHILYIFYFEFLWKTSFLSRNYAQKLLKEGTKILDFPSLNCGPVRIYHPLLCGGWVGGGGGVLGSPQQGRCQPHNNNSNYNNSRLIIINWGSVLSV